MVDRETLYREKRKFRRLPTFAENVETSRALIPYRTHVLIPEPNIQVPHLSR